MGSENVLFLQKRGYAKEQTKDVVCVIITRRQELKVIQLRMFCLIAHPLEALALLIQQVQRKNANNIALKA
jgi:hypothetical protein